MRKIKEIIEEIAILTIFMTRIPVGVKVYSEEKLGRGIKYFPLIGAIIGILLYTLAILTKNYVNNGYVLALFVILLEMALVGLIHLDGLSDTFDALFSYRDKEKMLEIMKDSRVGANGVIVLILYFLCKTIFLAEIINAGDMRIILIYPVISRLSTTINAGFGEYARNKGGMSAGIINMNGKKEAIFSAILTGFLILCVYNIKYLGTYNNNGIFILLIAISFIFFFKKFVYKKIGGITGDTMGASLELVVLLVLILGVILK